MKLFADLTSQVKVRKALYIIIAIYFGSYVFTGIAMPGQHQYHSIEILLIGWLGPLQLQFAWYANPFFVAGLIAARKGRLERARILSWVAALISLNSATIFFQGVMINAVPVFSKASNFGVGGYLWILSIWGFLGWSYLAIRAAGSNQSFKGDALKRVP